MPDDVYPLEELQRLRADREALRIQYQALAQEHQAWGAGPSGITARSAAPRRRSAAG